MASAASYQAQLPSSSVNPELSNGGYLAGEIPYTGDSFGSKILKWFTGYDEKQAYQNALTQNNRAYELALLQESRNYDAYLRNYNAMREDTQIQRMVKDIKAAGLNPWLALQSGGVSGSSAQSQTAGSYHSPSSGSSAKASTKQGGSSALAMLLMATARMIAAVG